jgi:hypothetical protein
MTGLMVTYIEVALRPPVKVKLIVRTLLVTGLT